MIGDPLTFPRSLGRIAKKKCDSLQDLMWSSSQCLRFSSTFKVIIFQYFELRLNTSGRSWCLTRSMLSSVHVKAVLLCVSAATRSWRHDRRLGSVSVFVIQSEVNQNTKQWTVHSSEGVNIILYLPSTWHHYAGVKCDTRGLGALVVKEYVVIVIVNATKRNKARRRKRIKQTHT